MNVCKKLKMQKNIKTVKNLKKKTVLVLEEYKKIVKMIGKLEKKCKKIKVKYLKK